MTELELLVAAASSPKDMAKKLIEFDWAPPDGWVDTDEETKQISDYTPLVEGTSLEFQALWLKGEIPDLVYEAVVQWSVKLAASS